MQWGNGEIKVNQNTSKGSHMVAQNVSMSGGKARRFLQNPKREKA